jgi:DNA-binding NarL/FixJ family response regulator
VTDPIRVAVVDDHRLFREGMRALFDSVPGVELVADGEDGHDAVRIATDLRPAVLLMDIRMPRLNGIEATRAIRKQRSDVAVVVLTMVEDDESVGEALREGARGYVLKGADPDEMLAVVRAAARGDLLLTGSIAQRAQLMLGAQPRPWSPPLPELSERERAVLDLLAAGDDPSRIAATLHLSPKTVRNYLTTIPRRLGVPDRATAVAVARQAGLGRR